MTRDDGDDDDNDDDDNDDDGDDDDLFVIGCIATTAHSRFTELPVLGGDSSLPAVFASTKRTLDSSTSVLVPCLW